MVKYNMDESMQDREMWFNLYEFFRSEGIPAYNLIFECIRDWEAHFICEMIRQYRPQTILEIGSFVGMSVGMIAYASAEAQVTCVDPGLPAHYFTELPDQAHAMDTLHFLHKMLFAFSFERKVRVIQGFASCRPKDDYEQDLAQAGVTFDHIPMVRDQVVANAPFDMVFIDGDHSTDSVCSDLTLVTPLLASQGIVVLHDVMGEWGESVTSGVQRFLQMGTGFHFETYGNIGCLSKQRDMFDANRLKGSYSGVWHPSL